MVMLSTDYSYTGFTPLLKEEISPVQRLLMFKMFKQFKCDFVQSYKSCEGERDARKGEKIDRYIGIEREMRKRVEK